MSGFEPKRQGRGEQITTDTTSDMDCEGGDPSEVSSLGSGASGRQPVVFFMEEDAGGGSRAHVPRGSDHPATRSPSPIGPTAPSGNAELVIVADMSVFADEQRRARLGEGRQRQSSYERQPTPIPNLVHLSQALGQEHRVFVPTNLSYYHHYSSSLADDRQRSAELDDLAKSLSRAHIASAAGSMPRHEGGLGQGHNWPSELSESRSLDERRLPQLWKDHDSTSL